MSSLQLEPGKFYKDRNGYIWCCFRVNIKAEPHCKADCVCTSLGSSRVEYFYLDGRYDTGGARNFCLIEEVPAGTLCKEDSR